MRVRPSQSAPTVTHREGLVSCSQRARATATARMNKQRRKPLSRKAKGLPRAGRSTASRKMPFRIASTRMSSQAAADLTRLRNAQFLSQGGHSVAGCPALRALPRRAARARAWQPLLRGSAGGAFASSELKRFLETAAISSTALRKASSLAFDGLLKPLTFLTNWSAAERISSSITGGSKLNNFKQRPQSVPGAPCWAAHLPGAGPAAGGTGAGTTFEIGGSDLRYANTARRSSSVISA